MYDFFLFLSNRLARKKNSLLFLWIFLAVSTGGNALLVGCSWSVGWLCFRFADTPMKGETVFLMQKHPLRKKKDVGYFHGWNPFLFFFWWACFETTHSLTCLSWQQSHQKAIPGAWVQVCPSLFPACLPVLSWLKKKFFKKPKINLIRSPSVPVTLSEKWLYC